MKSVIQGIREIHDFDLLAERNRLAKEIPEKQSRLDAIRREMKRRKRGERGQK